MTDDDNSMTLPGRGTIKIFENVNGMIAIRQTDDGGSEDIVQMHTHDVPRVVECLQYLAARIEDHSREEQHSQAQGLRAK